MKIGIDARLYTQTGVGRYLRNLLFELGKIDEKNTYVVYLRDSEFKLFDPPNKRWVKKRLDIPWHTLKEQLTIPFILLADKLDIVHFPYFNVPIFYPKKYLLTIHDLIVDHFDTGRASTLSPILYKSKRAAYKFATTIGIKKANWISVISKTTKKEVLKHYHPHPQKITVTYDALDINFEKTRNCHPPENIIGTPYILYVGNAYPHKNLKRCIDAFVLIRKKKKIRFVLAGEDNYFYPRIKKLVGEKGLEKEVIFFGDANDTDLVNLYSNCMCLVFPSLMEGFGLPNLEVLACNRLPVVSDIAVFREIWGNLLSYFDPTVPEDIANKVLKVITQPSSLYQRQVKKAREILTRFSWEKTARQTLNLYENCYSI